ncbi:hypothetical protein MRX96_007030 [Rhipicephalus microplus]
MVQRLALCIQRSELKSRAGAGASPTSSTSLPSQPEKLPLAAPQKEPEKEPTTVTVATSVTKATSSSPVPQANVDQPADEGMDTTQEPASTAPGKRPHDQTSSSEPHQDDGGGDEPPTKAPGARRFPLKPKPNISGEPQQAAANPPP